MAEKHRGSEAEAPVAKSSTRSSGEKKSSGAGMMSRLFNRQVSILKGSRSMEITPFSNCPQDSLRSTESPPVIGPCPFIRPLGLKLEARFETSGLPSPPERSGSVACAVMCDVESTCNMSEDTESSLALSPALISWMTDDSLKAVLEGDYFDNEFAGKNATIDKDAIRAQFIQQVRDIADSAAKNFASRKPWKVYLICYSKGQFNMISPPEPPSRRSDLKYLPSIFPRNEVRRLSASNSFDIVWPEWTQEKAGALIGAAMKRFKTKFAALSFFDSDHEMFKAENGYKGSKIERHISIAAHALLSNDVLVILDTTKDWRFRSNPLVTTEPHIRFFAGAPMLAANGQAVGVLSIFDVVPRPDFDPFDRRALMQFGALTMQDLELQVSKLTEPDCTPLLDKDSTINDDYLIQKLTSLGSAMPFGVLDTDLIPPALRFHKIKTPPRQHSRIFISEDLRNDICSPLSQTPPSSNESEHVHLKGSSRLYGRDHRKLPSLKYTTMADALITPDSAGFRMPTPRPFSSSDITSLHIDPPNTPNRSVDGRKKTVQPQIDLTIENFMSLSDNDCAEEPYLDTTHESEPRSGSSHHKWSPRCKTPHASLPPQGLSEIGQPNGRAEAAFSLSFAAKSLGYDLMYVLDIKPARPFMTDEELLSPDGLQMKVLVAHGLKESLTLGPQMHLEALRMRDFKIWESRREHYEPGEYQCGYLKAIHTEGGPLYKRNRGIIFGAYRKPRYDGHFSSTSSAAEQDKLGEAADAVKNILFKRRRSKEHKRSNTQPPAQRSFTTREAREIGTSAFGQGPQHHRGQPPFPGALQHHPSTEHLRPTKYSPCESRQRHL